MEKLEATIQDLKVLQESEQESQKHKDASDRKIQLLESELEKSENTIRETTKK